MGESSLGNPPDSVGSTTRAPAPRGVRRVCARLPCTTAKQRQWTLLPLSNVLGGSRQAPPWRWLRWCCSASSTRSRGPASPSTPFCPSSSVLFFGQLFWRIVSRDRGFPPDAPRRAAPSCAWIAAACVFPRARVPCRARQVPAMCASPHPRGKRQWCSSPSPRETTLKRTFFCFQGGGGRPTQRAVFSV